MFRDLFSLKATSDDLLHLDLLRFVASAGIVLCHSGEFFFERTQRFSHYENLAGLALFVDVFFIISGFVIAHVYADRIAGWRPYARFMQRRVGRLYPLHIATMIIVGLLFYAVNKVGYAANTDMRLLPGCLAAGAFLIHSVIDCGGPVPNGVNWSISAEMVMYLAFPLLLLVARSIGVLRYSVWIGLLWYVSTLYPENALWGTKLEFWRAVPTFFFGMAVRLDWQAWSRIPVPGAVPILLSLVMIGGSLAAWPGWLMLTLAYLTPLTGIIADGRGKFSPVTRKLAPLGQLTYSIYMLHPIVIMVMVNAVGDKWLKLDVLPLSILTLLSYPVIAAVSLLSYKLYETPARKFIDGLKLVPPDPVREVAERV